MCCILAALALFGPRLAIIVWWLFRPIYFSTVFSTIIWPILGIIFLPFTTLAYLIVAPYGVTGFNWIWIILGLVIDISVYYGSYFNKDKVAMGA